MQIIIVRHGKPLLQSQTSISSIDFEYWIKNYNQAELCRDAAPQSEIINLAKDCGVVICSNLSRSLDSAKLLGINNIFRSEYNLREMEMPCGKLFGISLKPKYWAIIFRVLWFCGYSKKSESFKDAKLRAEQAALMLESIAKEKQSVLFVGHGLLNRFIAKNLVSRGWKAEKKMGSNYWDFGVFELVE
jgi:broad specificity phosphatase PhoE